MDIYREIILDHYKHPRNFGILDHADRESEAYNATCGDKIRIQIILTGTGKNSRVEEVRFSGVGCAISQAAASMLTEKIKNMKTADIAELKPADIMTMLGTSLTPSRVKCATLPLEVLKKALLQ
jgi:nitrogen fixation protein NifU and related proteins